MSALTRHNLKALAESKLEDALFLFLHERYSNAYYLAGYAIELALKSCLSQQFSREHIPDKNFVNSIHTHDFLKLIDLAGLRIDLNDKQKSSAEFSANWALVRQWTPEARYSMTDQYTCRLFIEATSDPFDGVLPWIRMHW